MQAAPPLEGRLAAILPFALQSPHCLHTAWGQTITSPVSTEAIANRHTWRPADTLPCHPNLLTSTPHVNRQSRPQRPQPLSPTAGQLRTTWRPVCSPIPTHLLGADSLQRCRQNGHSPSAHLPGGRHPPLVLPTHWPQLCRWGLCGRLTARGRCQHHSAGWLHCAACGSSRSQLAGGAACSRARGWLSLCGSCRGAGAVKADAGYLDSGNCLRV